MPGIGNSHLAPNNFEKMKVSLAMQLFGFKIQDGITVYKEQLIESYGIRRVSILQKFLVKINDVICIMTSHYKGEALFFNSEDEQKLKEFLVFLDEWKSIASEKGGGYLTDQTSEGLRMTISSVLGLLKYLAEEAGFSYLLTSRVSQDALENFFGIVRASTPTNDHPAPSEFLSIVEVLSVCSILKPIAQGNSLPTDFSSLLSYECDRPKNKRQENSLSIEKHQESMGDHTYLLSCSNPRINAYFAGYVARRFIMKTTCATCSSSLVDTNNLTSNAESSNIHSLTISKDKGGLIYASKSLIELLCKLDAIFMDHISSHKLSRDTYYELLKKFSPSNFEIGCEIHRNEITNKIAAFVIMCRLAFHIKNINNESFNKHQFLKYGKLRKTL